MDNPHPGCRLPIIINSVKNMVLNEKQKTLIDFKKAQGHISKIIKMIEEDEYCVGIMHQNLAAVGILKSAQQKLMQNHLNTCFKRAFESKNDAKKRQMTAEILKIIKLFNK